MPRVQVATSKQRPLLSSFYHLLRVSILLAEECGVLGGPADSGAKTGGEDPGAPIHGFDAPGELPLTKLLIGGSAHGGRSSHISVCIIMGLPSLSI